MLMNKLSDMDNERFTFPLQIGEIMAKSQEVQNLIADFGLDIQNIITVQTVNRSSNNVIGC